MISSETSQAQMAVELEKLYAINQTAARAGHWKPALEQITPLLRSILIFDNLVFYLPGAGSQSPEVGYARVVGRGRSAGADIAWGESIAQQVFQTGEPVLQQPVTGEPVQERIQAAYLLGIPVRGPRGTAGALVFIRFGGPAYSDRDRRTADYLAGQLLPLVELDASEARRQEIEAERAQFRLQEDFVSTISHELMTPLGFIKGYTTTLLRADATWDEGTRQEFLSIIDTETDRLQELIDNLLDSARLQSGTLGMEFQPVRLDGMIKDVTNRARSHHADLQFALDLASDLPPAMADPHRLAQVFENLIGNARKYAPGSPIGISLSREGEAALICFTDAGPGIPEQYREHVFERFFRNPEQAPNVRGTGLGLYICRQIVEAHQGRIWVESNAGSGSKFCILLPFHQPEPGRNARG